MSGGFKRPSGRRRSWNQAPGLLIPVPILPIGTRAFFPPPGQGLKFYIPDSAQGCLKANG